MNGHEKHDGKDRIYRYDLDAAGQPRPEGYYVCDARGSLILMPPTGEMEPGLRLATQAEVDRGGAVQASAEHIANCDPTPSDRG